jgi:hypothetical protein
MTADATRHCTVCDDPSLCKAHGLLRSQVTQGSWDSTPITTEIRCEVEDDKPGAFVYGIVIRLAERQGITVSELMDGAE